MAASLRRRGWIRRAALGSFLLSAVAHGQTGIAVLTGIIVDASTHEPLRDVVVMATSPALQGEQVAISDASGLYRVPQLPSGTYALRFDKDGYRVLLREGIEISADRTLRMNVELLPEAALEETIIVRGEPPIIDVGSSAVVTGVDSQAMAVLPLSRPGGIGGASRSFDSVATFAPQTAVDLYGVSINGATSPENTYLVDRLAVNNLAFGTLGTPLSAEFMGEVNVITGGYLPEYGHATGGIISATTRSGGNEFHGSVFGTFTPGGLTGWAASTPSRVATVVGSRSVGNIGDAGATLGGYIVRDRLWFFAGIQWSAQRYVYARSFNQFIVPGDGSGHYERILDSTQHRNADERTLQYLAKLTYLFSSDHRVSVTVSGTPTHGGGDGGVLLRTRSTARSVAGSNALTGGTYSTLDGRTTFDALDVTGGLESSFLQKQLLLDLRLGWHHQHDTHLAGDGTGLKDVDALGTLAGTPFVTSPRGFGTPVYVLDPSVPTSVHTACTAPQVSCDVLGFAMGGVGQMEDLESDSFQARAVVTGLFRAAGHHVVKAGFEGQFSRYRAQRAFSGGAAYANASDATGSPDDRGAVVDTFHYGSLSAVDTLVDVPGTNHLVHSSVVGGFAQDSFSVLDVITLNAGIRFDALQLKGADGKAGITLNDQWSPRLGLVWDPTQAGHSRIFFNYARYFELIPMDIADKSLTGLGDVSAIHDCDPLVVGRKVCDQDVNTRLTGSQVLGFSSESPNRRWVAYSPYPTPVDADLRSPAVNEIVAGGEYEVLPNARLGLSYTYRNLVRAVEDMSNNDGATYFIGNPGEGIADSFPRATRKYHAVTLSFSRSFHEGWLAQASYTWSQLRGNYDGLFVPNTGQLDPNINTTFDTRTSLLNQEGPLSADTTHVVKVFAAKELAVTPWLGVTLGAGFVASSGVPISALGPNGAGTTTYLLERGGAGRMPWVTSLDARLAVSYRASKDVVFSGAVEAFNLFNSQRPTAVDQNYVGRFVIPGDSASPILGARQGSVPSQYGGLCSGTDPSTCVPGNGSLPRPKVDSTGAPIKVALPDQKGQRAVAFTRLTWGTSTNFQPVRQFRFSLRVSF